MFSIDYDSNSLGSIIFQKPSIKRTQKDEKETTRIVHNYNTRSSARKNRSGFSIDHPKIKFEVPEKQVIPETGCGDAKTHLARELGEFKWNHVKLENLKNNSKLPNMDVELNTRRCSIYNRVLKIFILVGIMGLVIINMVDRVLYNSAMTMKNIREDIWGMKRELEALDSKLSEVVTEVLPILSKNQMLLRHDLKGLFQEQNNLIQNSIPSMDSIKELVRNAFGQYDADKTGMADYALESAGGSVVDTRGTETYTDGTPMLSLLKWPLCSASNSPSTIIKPSNLPGECWAFKGNSGAAVIQLLTRVLITGVSLEHIPASIDPTGQLRSAPKEFSIWGLDRKTDKEGHFLGKYEYDIKGPAVQFFPVGNCAKPFNFVHFKVHSNHGHPEYTCVYRIRVHGKLG